MIRRSHGRRSFTAFLAVLSLLFSQLALANYVCPAEADNAAMAEMMAAGQPCTGMDQVQPLLCHQHAVDAAQTFEAVKLPVPTMPALVQAIVVPLVLDARAAQALPPSAAAEARPPPDPVFLATLRLRV